MASIHPNKGRLAKVYGVYMQVSGNHKTDTMRILNLVFSIIILCGCGSQESKETSSQTNIDTVRTDTSTLITECIQKDTITDMGTTIHYIYRNGKHQISWGDKSYNRIYDSLYSCDYDNSTGLWDFVPKLNSETKNNLIFTNILWTTSGSNPAPLEYYAIICPKNSKDTIFEKDFFIDKEADYLVYGDPDNENVHIVNMETKRSQTIILIPKPYISRSPTLSIQKTEIKGKTFYIEYGSLDKSD
ncbi:MAG: hypothetical protein HYZ42_00525, partial [Bacteroidetes bacterium]|nr:hypothetical protein [Bacteroidota bacterium]